jgi:hypothetical protein
MEQLWNAKRSVSAFFGVFMNFFKGLAKFQSIMELNIEFLHDRLVQIRSISPKWTVSVIKLGFKPKLASLKSISIGIPNLSSLLVRNCKAGKRRLRPDSTPAFWLKHQFDPKMANTQLIQICSLINHPLHDLPNLGPLSLGSGIAPTA